uniref:EOG090X0CWG n=1 Tax=Eubosmina coregoni TaxID=186181 RepID=A0A4Y7LR59_9CRUS|nr:EOG090X0CWG [Eubosmina coregoni]SVE70045.1 EOG090X0CWG [Eubosmina coregoni]
MCDQELLDFSVLIEEKLNLGENLIQDLTRFRSVDGVGKLEKRIQSELKHLRKLQASPGGIKKEWISSSNLGSLNAIVDILMKCHDPVSVLKPFRTEFEPTNRLEVDVISDGGNTWHKAVARNAKALQDISLGKTSCGQKSAVDQAKTYLQCAQRFPHHFKVPQVVFWFANNVTKHLASKLTSLGIKVEGDIQVFDEDSSEETSQDDSDVEDSEEESIPPVIIHQEVEELFLDITCMVAYVSSMTNGDAQHNFRRPFYKIQAEQERVRPVKPELEALFQRHGQRLVTCQSALVDFQGLVETISGPEERRRSLDLIRRLRIVPDSPSDSVLGLKLTSSCKPRSRVIFGTADKLCMAVVTANTGFIRSAACQGKNIAHFAHEPRVLAEQEVKSDLKLIGTQ